MGSKSPIDGHRRGKKEGNKVKKIAILVAIIALLVVGYTGSRVQAATLRQQLASAQAQLAATQMPAVMGKVYFDSNSNGVLDPMDRPVSNIQIEFNAKKRLPNGSVANTPNLIKTTTDAYGVYVFRVAPGEVTAAGIQNTSQWNVTWLATWPIVTEDRGIYLGPIIFLRQGKKD